jgi:cell division septation protein DedD
MAQRRYRLQLNMIEGSMLVVSCLFASFLIFVFGIYVGKEVQAQKTVEQAKPLRVPVGGSKTALLDRSPASPLASRPGPQPAVAAQERAVPKQTAQRPRPASPPSLTVLAKAKPTAPKPEAKPHTRAPKPPKERPAAPTARQEKLPAKPRLWSVQVQATTRENAARQTVLRLRRQGYSPSISRVVRQDTVWYRVRVGPFSKELEAKAAVSRFRRQKTFAQAYPVSH